MTSFGTAGGGAQDDNDAKLRAKRGELLARVLYEKDKVIFRDGSDGTDAFIVESGRIGVFKVIEGKPVRLAVLEKGAMFGEMAAITGERRSATTMALEPSVVVRISKSQVMQKLGSCDPFIKALIGILINNLTRTNERYAVKNLEADKLVASLKAATEKVVEAEAAAAEAKAEAAKPEAAPDDATGPIGKNGSVS